VPNRSKNDGKAKFLQIENALTGAEVRAVVGIARQARLIEGRHSNPHNTPKMNLIGNPSDPVAQKASQIALSGLQDSATDLSRAPCKGTVFQRVRILPGVSRSSR
jgi:hypothetical protein